MSTTQQVACRLDVELLDRIDRLADRLGQSRSDVMRAALMRGLDHGESVAEVMESPVLRQVIRLVSRGTETAETQQRISEVIEHMNETASEKRTRKKTKRGAAT